MGVEKRVLQMIQARGPKGLTAFEAVAETGNLPQTVYPCFTRLCKDELILDSQTRRKSPKGRKVIVWVGQEYGGVVPVWQNGQPTYSYGGRTKTIMDELRNGPQPVSRLATKFRLEQMSLSSLMSRLRDQGWIRSLPEKVVAGNRSCLCFELTPRGRRVIEENS